MKKSYLIEGVLIIFSVLFALFINNLAHRYQKAQDKRTAIHYIQKEIYRNMSILKDFKSRHEQVNLKLDSLLDGQQDRLIQQLRQAQFFNFAILTNDKSLIDGLLIKTAWESAKTTGIVSEFDFKTIQELTLIYSMQDQIMNETLGKIYDLYFSLEGHNMENLDAILIQFKLRFTELTGQEHLLGSLYERSLEQLATE